MTAADRVIRWTTVAAVIGVAAVAAVVSYKHAGGAAARGSAGRELDVMRLVAGGNTTRQIGDTLFISPRTVEMHVPGSLLKLVCRTRAEAVRRLAELDTLPPAGPGPTR
jgi:DNA-binding CsgD family transcriptional regulator